MEYLTTQIESVLPTFFQLLDRSQNYRISNVMAIVWPLKGATENARHENTGRSKMQGWKMRDMNLRHQNARVENARHENAAPICKGGKCGKS